MDTDLKFLLKKGGNRGCRVNTKLVNYIIKHLFVTLT